MKIDIEGALLDELDAVGFVPTASRLYRPSPGVVSRSALVDRVRARNGDVVTVTAPAGYGKSTFVAEVTSGDPRPAAWVSLTAAENDPATLLTYIALALDAIEPVDARCVSALWARAPTIGSPALQRFGAMLAARREPFVLVLDDVHELVSRDVQDILPVLVSEMPHGSSIVFAGRTTIPLPLGRIRVRRRLVEVGLADLAFDEREAATLFHALGVDVAPADNAALIERTEGWPVATYLAALATGRSPLSSVVADFAGDHRYFVDYLGEELLTGLDPDTAAFLMDASCLDHVSGPLCDEVLQRTGSAELLAVVQRQTLLVIPLDERREWYRFHHLMSEFLRAELARREPDRPAAIHRRASEWCDAQGDPDGAVGHAVLGGDLARAESMVLRRFPIVSPGHRRDPTPDRGEAGPALQWLARAAAALPDRHPAPVRGWSPSVALAMARMVIAPLTPAEMATEAMYVYRHVGLGDGHPLSCLALGAAAFMSGDEDEAMRRLREGADTTLPRPLVVASCLAHIAVIDVEHGRWREAEIAARRAKGLLGDAASFASSVLVVAMNVLVETHAGRGAEVEPDRQQCDRHLAELVGVAPWLNLQARVALARDALIRGNRIRAAALVDDAEAILGAIPEAVRGGAQLAAIRREMTSRVKAQGFGPSSLTTAELRVLRLLPTHLSIAEIAESLYVSRNTVKSQTIAIYRKLGTSSRSGAIAIAMASDLLDAAARLG